MEFRKHFCSGKHWWFLKICDWFSIWKCRSEQFLGVNVFLVCWQHWAHRPLSTLSLSEWNAADLDVVHMWLQDHRHVLQWSMLLYVHLIGSFSKAHPNPEPKSYLHWLGIHWHSERKVPKASIGWNKNKLQPIHFWWMKHQHHFAFFRCGFWYCRSRTKVFSVRFIGIWRERWTNEFILDELLRICWIKFCIWHHLAFLRWALLVNEASTSFGILEMWFLAL